MSGASNASVSESPRSTPQSRDLTDEKRFDIYLEALRDAHTSMADFHVKLFAILLVVIGWFSASTNPLPLLCTFPLFSMSPSPAPWLAFLD